MKDELKESLEFLESLYGIHSKNALEYSYRAVCQYRFRGEEKQALEARAEALFHDGKAKGLRDSIFQIKNVLLEEEE